MLILQLARSVTVFVVARLVQGIAGALVVVASFALIGDAVPQYCLGQTVGYLGSAIASGFFLGPFLGGIVYNAGGYDAVFWFAYPIIAIDTVMRLALVEKKVAAEWTGSNRDLESDLEAEQRNHAAVPCEPVAVPRKRGWVLLKMLKQRRVLISSGALLVQGLLLSAFDAVHCRLGVDHDSLLTTADTSHLRGDDIWLEFSWHGSDLPPNGSSRILRALVW
jgi:MFS family permease